MKRKLIIFLLVFSLMGLTLRNIPPLNATIHEDFSSDYTEIDPNNHITVKNSSYVDFQAERGEDAHLYRDFEAGFFENFTHTVNVLMNSSIESSVCPVWGLTNEVDDYKGISTSGNTTIYVYMRRQNSPPLYLISLREYYDVDTPPSESYQNLSNLITVDTWYYLTIEKNGTSLVCDIYTDEARSSLFQTLSLTLHANHNFRYMMACNTHNTGHPNIYGIVHIWNLWLGFESYYVTFYFTEGGILRLDNPTTSNGTQVEFLNGTQIELAGLVQNASYIWLNYTWGASNATSNPYNLTVTQNATVWCYFSVAPEGYAGYGFIFLGVILGLVVGAMVGYGSKRK